MSTQVAVQQPVIVAAPPKTRRWLSRGLLVVMNVTAVGTLLAPLFMRHGLAGEAGAHGSDAPVLVALAVPALLAVAVGEIAGRKLDSKGVALLGVLCGLNAALRLPGAFAGASLVFFLPIVCGYVFGSTFGFLLGALSFAVSAVITAGVGPWLPFQMFALGWVGAGAAMLRPLLSRLRGRRGLVIEVLALCAYGYLAGFLFGIVTDLWFWPFFAAGDSQIAWRAGLGFGASMRNFWRFYVVTSLGWDASRAVGNVLLIGVLGAPVIHSLRRWQRKMWPLNT